MHYAISITETQILEKYTIKMLLSQAKTNILSSKCFSNEICEKIEQFTENINISENLLESINIVYNKLTTTSDGEAFYLLFYSKVILKSSTYFCPLESPYSTLLAQKLADKIFYHCKQPKEQSITKSTPTNDKEIGALQYLAGYLVKKIKLKTLNCKDYKLDLNQSWVKIMDHATVEGNYEHKLISTLNCGGLAAVKLPFPNIFLITEEKFRYVTQQNTHLVKININELTDPLFENTEFISYFNSIVHTSGVDNFDDNAHEKLLHGMVSLYL